MTIDSYVAVSVRGAPLATQIEYSISGTLTASTATIANRLAKELDVVVKRSEDKRNVTLTLAPPPDTTLLGSIELTIPAKIELEVGSEHEILVESMERSATATGYDQVRFVGNSGNVRAVTRNGNVVIDSALLPSTSATAEVGSGHITLLMPRNVSASIEAAASGGFVVNHPAFPRPLGTNRTSYSAVVNGGHGLARLLAQAGTVTLSAKP